METRKKIQFRLVAYPLVIDQFKLHQPIVISGEIDLQQNKYYLPNRTFQKGTNTHIEDTLLPGISEQNRYNYFAIFKYKV